MVEFVPATPALMESIAENMREADRREVMASHGFTPIESLTASLKVSRYATVATSGGIPWAVFGLADYGILSNIGCPWMLGTNDVVKNGRDLMRHSPKVIYEMLNVYSTLQNYVHVENIVSVNWLQRIGFTLYPAIPYGMNGELFYPFQKKRI